MTESISARFPVKGSDAVHAKRSERKGRHLAQAYHRLFQDSS